jgi:hypothetical protein
MLRSHDVPGLYGHRSPRQQFVFLTEDQNHQSEYPGSYTCVYSVCDTNYAYSTVLCGP